MAGKTFLFSLLVAACSYGVAAQGTECENATLADIVFLVDGSTSIGTKNFQLVRLFLNSSIKSLDVGLDKVRIGLVQYSDEPHEEFLLHRHKDKDTLLAAVEKLPYRTGNTYTGKAIDFLRTQVFTKKAGSRTRQRVPQIAVVITDGDSADDVKEPSRKLNEHGVLVFSIGVGKMKRDQLKSIANIPSEHFMFSVGSFQELQEATLSLLKSVCVYAETRRRALSEQFIDLFFLVDSNIPPGPFAGYSTQILDMVNKMNVQGSAHRIGLAQYGEDTAVHFLLNRYETKEETLEGIRQFQPQPKPKKLSDLDGALRYARDHFFSSEAGSRAHQGFPQLLMVLTGEHSNLDLMSRPARALTSFGIAVNEMKADGRALLIDVMGQHGFSGRAGSVFVDRFIASPLKLITEDCKEATKADIVFIVDESGSIGTTNFQIIRTFLHSIVLGLDISQSRVRVGIVTYNDNPTAQVYLDSFDDKNEFLEFIQMLPYRSGGTKTGAALKFTREEIFTEQRGRRNGVQQVAVVITDGESQDDVSREAMSLRRSGVTVYAVGIKEANETQLFEMASYPSNKHLFNVDSFIQLRPLRETLQKTLCDNIILEAVTVSTGQTDAKKACERKDEADFFFLMDDSGSIENLDFDEMKKFIIKFVHTFRIGPEHIRMGLVKYATSPSVEFDLTAYSDAGKVEKAVMGIRHKGGGTRTGRALSSMGPLFEDALVSRGNKVPAYLIVITDGKSADRVKAHAEKLRAQGVNIYAIGVKNANETELREIAGDPSRTFFVSNFDALKSIHSGVITEICTPDACKDMQSDVFFLAESSGIMSPQEYQTMKDFMKSVINKSNIGPSEIRVGVMQFSTKAEPEFPLDRFFSKEELSTAIDNMQQMNEGILTGNAITQVEGYFDATRGGRPNLSQRLILITSSNAQDEIVGPAAALRAKGVLVYSVGVVDANITQLIEISGSSDQVFKQNSFSALQDLDSQVALKLCDPTRDCEKTKRADIIFLVDISSTIDATEFKSMQKFMESMVNQTTVGTNLTRFGVILYSDAPQSHFTLDQYDSKRKVLEAIAGLDASGGNTYTGRALTYSLQFFSAEHGGRKGTNVPQILMVITDGDATDPHNLKVPSDALRDSGVSVLSIGVEGAIRDQLETIAGGDTSKVFYVDNFEALEPLYKNISAVLCNYIKPDCEKEKADLVFLLDQSSSISIPNYSIMKNFTTELVSSFEVSKEFVHVGLAEFSDDPQHGFYLDTYADAEDVKRHILNMEYRGGNTNIGRALYYVREYFAESRGSRSGISKNLVLITDGDSHDDVEDAADLLRASGVEMFAIGVGDVHDLELLQITGTPERLFNVQNFDGLANIKKRMTKAICTSVIKHDCSIDIGIGFDISKTRNSDDSLLSGHFKLSTALPEIVRHVSSVEGLCCTGPKPVQTNIALQVVDRDGRSLYDKTIKDQDDVRRAMTAPIPEASYFNAALLNSFKQRFKESAAGVKVLLIFSDGLDDEVAKLQEESELLRQSGVSALLTVALQGARDPAQLQMVEFGRGFGHKLPLRVGMPSVGSSVLEEIKTVSDRECCNVVCKCSGGEGARGSRGPPGSKGGPGRTGRQGFPGDEGVAGERGPSGPEGAQGTRGCPGARGLKGTRGVSGSRGGDGDHGLDGVDGEPGLTGPDGARGERGHPGNPGIPGIRGEAGPEGRRGVRGDPGDPGPDNIVPGAKGEPGNPGLPGPAGAEGRPGESGVRGDQGPNGRAGSVGLKGAPGGPGARGPSGSPGASGPQGPRGETGGPGPEGIPGFPGPQGRPGRAGTPGQVGRGGANGQKGQPGDPGVKGSPGSQGPRGMPGQDGRDGYGPSGPKGVKGDPGFPGYPGLGGEEGLQGPKGHPGGKGTRGGDGVSGGWGEAGGAGDPGYPGHKGPRGPPGGRDRTECQLITFIREKCVCSRGRSECPAYPTELVLGLDMSEDVTPVAFERQRSALLALLEDVAVAESNCPTGARVAVVGYSAYTKYLIRFQDYRFKKQLIESVRNIALERTSHRRQLGAAMRFVGQNVFKRVRAGVMMRKVAVFFSNGPTQDVNDIVTAVMEHRGLDIVSAVISLRKAPTVGRAMEVDDSGNSIFTVLGRNMAADLRKVRNCAICYDPCRRSEQCAFIQETPQPQDLDLDLAMVVDSSREMQADEYAGVQQLLGSVVEQLAVSPQPRRAGNQARVAVVQQSGTRVTKPEFGLQTHQSHEQMKKHLIQNMQQQGGSSALGHTLDFTLREVLLKAGQPRRRRALLTVVGTQTAYEDRAQLHYISQKAKCEGVALFVVTVGERYNRTQVEELASPPVQQHLIHAGRLRADERGYARRFFRVFLTALNKGMNSYPPAPLKASCEQLRERDAGQTPAGGQQSEQFEELTGRVEVNAVEDVCSLSSDAGGCLDYAPMWSFDSELGRCSHFWYGGCGGNENRFETKADCESVCVRR